MSYVRRGADKVAASNGHSGKKQTNGKADEHGAEMQNVEQQQIGEERR
jgi:hypothetical protein